MPWAETVTAKAFRRNVKLVQENTLGKEWCRYEFSGSCSDKTVIRTLLNQGALEP
jgi:hypothetical protein